MKKNSLPGFGASVLVVMALSACSGGTAAAPASAPASETATATLTPAKQYTTEELVALAGQVKATDGSSPGALSGAELEAKYDPLKSSLGKTTIEPAACRDMSVLGAVQSVPGSVSAGTARTKTAGVITDLTLTSGVDVAVLQERLDNIKSQAEACKKVTFTSSGQSITTSTEKAEGIGSVPGTVAFKTSMVMPDGEKGAIYTAHVIKDGVLISATSSGNDGDAGGPTAISALMDQAAALIK
jgi:hypothetical protein